MAAPLLSGLPPIIGEGAQTLILGNMLSVMSVAAQQYYGNPRNAFWRITGELFGFAADDPYDDRVRRASLARHRGVGCAQVCRRVGSLDSAVEPDSMVPNDFGELFDAYPDITRVLQRSGGGEELQVVVVSVATEVRYRRLPSTSPAETMRYEDKLAVWREAITGRPQT